jgi:hypothetical protein
MTDLLDAIAEHSTERAAIMAESNCYTVDAHADDLKRYEVATVLRWYWPDDTDAAKRYFGLVEKARGKESADKLRDACRSAWIVKAREAQA